MIMEVVSEGVDEVDGLVLCGFVLKVPWEQH